MPTPPKAKQLPPQATQNVTLRLQSRKLARLDAEAERLGTTRSALIQIAIAEYLERRATPLAR